VLCPHGDPGSRACRAKVFADPASGAQVRRDVQFPQRPLVSPDLLLQDFLSQRFPGNWTLFNAYPAIAAFHVTQASAAVDRRGPHLERLLSHQGQRFDRPAGACLGAAIALVNAVSGPGIQHWNPYSAPPYPAPPVVAT